jgi:hypothetical protein
MRVSGEMGITRVLKQIARQVEFGDVPEKEAVDWRNGDYSR